MTLRPWPEGAIPTPDQLADWLEVCTREQRIELSARMLASDERASRCFMEDHDHLREEVGSLRRQVSEQYQKGWNDAVQEALTAVDNA